MKKILKPLSAIAAALLVLPVFMIHPSAEVTNSAIKEKQNQISGYQAQLKEQRAASEAARQRIAEIKNDIEQTEEHKNELIEKIGVLNADIATTEELIKSYEEFIALKEEEIKATGEQLDKQDQELVEFLRYDYESGSSSLKTIEFLLNSASLSEFLSNLHYMGTLMDYQEHLLQKLENTVTEYEGQKYDLQTALTAKEEYSALLKDQLEETNELMGQAMEYIVKLEASQAEYEVTLASSEDEEKLLSAAIAKAQEEKEKLIEDEIERQRILEEERKRKEEEERKKREAEEKARQAAEQASQDAKAQQAANDAAKAAAAYGKDNYMWPLPMNSGFRLTGWFGYEPNPIGSGIRLHKAWDIGVAGGTKIYASKSGTVVTAKYSSSYGNYVIILHADGYSTLYAHSSKLLVKTGQTVKQGDVIALVGTTGYSTGNHLHFEIIKPDGKTRLNLDNYFPAILASHKGDSNRYDYLNNPRPSEYKP